MKANETAKETKTRGILYVGLVVYENTDLLTMVVLRFLLSSIYPLRLLRKILPYLEQPCHGMQSEDQDKPLVAG